MAKRGRPPGKKGPPGTIDQREQKFVEGILRGLCKRDAALFAGYAKSTAIVMATEISERPHVADQLTAFYKKDEYEARVAHELMRRVIFEAATTDTSSAYDESGNLKPIHEMEPAVRRQIVSLRSWDSPEQGSGFAVKFHHKVDAAKAYIKAIPLPPPDAEDLQGAAESARSKFQELLDRMEEDDEEDEAPEDGAV